MSLDHQDAYEQYESFAEQFDPEALERRGQRHHAPRKRPSRPSLVDVVEALAEPAGLEVGLQTTYRPGRFEQGWLLQSLGGFFEEGLITDVLALVKGGKEANVYCCRAAPALDHPLVAAKVYRPQQFRNLRNDAIYRRGRQVLTDTGHALNKSNHREMRALGKKTAYGRQLAHTSWLMHEYGTLQRLHAAGGAVPQPIAAAPNALLMAYAGDAQMAAPTLSGLSLGIAQLERLFPKVVHNIALMLSMGLVHGDLSAYNILYWQDDIVIIDWPQVVDIATNPHAHDIYRRDILRIHSYFAPCLDQDAQTLADALWQTHVGPWAPPIDWVDAEEGYDPHEG